MFWGTEGLDAHPGIQSSGKPRPACFVYFITDGTRAAKIGVALRPWVRLKELQTGSSSRLECLYLIPCKTKNDAYEIEGLLHRNFKRYRMHGEWFSILDKLKHDSYSSQFPASRYWPNIEQDQDLPFGALGIDFKTFAPLVCNEYNGPMFISATEAARLTGYAPNTIRKGCRTGKIPCIRIGDARNKRYMVNMTLYAKQFRDFYNEEEKSLIKEFYLEAN